MNTEEELKWRSFFCNTASDYVILKSTLRGFQSRSVSSDVLIPVPDPNPDLDFDDI